MRRVAELSKRGASDHCWNMEMKTNLCHDTLLELGPVEEVLEKGKETGLTLSAEEVQILLIILDNCTGTLNEMVEDWSW